MNELKSLELIGGFENALKAIKEGKKVRRCGWNGKNLYVQLWNCKFETFVSNPQMLAIFSLSEETLITPNSWVPSSSDLMALDWEIIE